MDLTIDVEDYKLNVRATVIIEHNGKILVHRNVNSNHYALIGGRVKIGEDSETTVKREVMEELGKKIEVIGYVTTIENFFEMKGSKYHEILMNDVFFMKTIAKNLASKLSKSTQNQSISLNYPVENRLAAYFIVSHKNSIIQDNFVVVAELVGCSYRQLQRVLQLFLDKKYIKKIKRGTYQIIDLNALNLLGEDVYQF